MSAPAPKTVTTTLYPAWREAVKQLLDSGLAFGGVVTREQIIHLCGIRPAVSINDVDRFELEVLQAIASIKHHLLYQHSMYMYSSKAGSYTIARPQDQTGMVLDTGRRAIRKAMTRMSDGVTCIRADLLSAPERAYNVDAQAKISQLRGMIKQPVAQLR
jgi:hypothetical protein